MWVLFAFGSAIFAGLTAILAKFGIRNTESNVATAIRTVVILLFSWLMVFLVGSQEAITRIGGRTLLFLVLSGLATGGSWLCYFKALQIGDVNKVTPVDKSSTVMTMIIAIIFLREPITIIKVAAMILIGIGTYLMIEKKKTAQTIQTTGRNPINHTDLTAQTDQASQTNQPNEEGQTERVGQTSKPNQSTEAGQTDRTEQLSQFDIVNQTNPKDRTSPIDQANQSSIINQTNPMHQNHSKPTGPARNLWIVYAFGAASFASLTSILGKIGIEGVESNLGTAIRTIVVLVMAWLVVFVTKKQDTIKDIDTKSWIFLILSGFATGGSWLCYYRALQDGPASVVVPIDKLSIVLTIAFSYVFLKEKLTKKSAIGLAMIVTGTMSLLL